MEGYRVNVVLIAIPRAPPLPPHDVLNTCYFWEGRSLAFARPTSPRRLVDPVESCVVGTLQNIPREAENSQPATRMRAAGYNRAERPTRDAVATIRPAVTWAKGDR